MPLGHLYVFFGEIRSSAYFLIGLLCLFFFFQILSLKESDAGRDWGQEEKGMTEDEMAGWHHRLDGHESQ